MVSGENLESCHDRTAQEDLAEGLANCAREAVHAPGAIQPAGCLVCVDADMQRVVRVSSNIGEFLGVTPAEALDLSPTRLLEESLLDQLGARLYEGEALPLSLECPREAGKAAGRLQATVYQSGDRWVFEFEPLASPRELRTLRLIHHWTREFRDSRSRDQLLSRLVEAVESLTGFDRTMVYQFDEHWHGTVVSEKRHGGMGSYLDHRFPATDIPPQVRALYDVNPVRSIPDSAASPVSLIGPAEEAEDALDMGPGYLRAVSPVHVQYLENMGVAASLSVALHGPDGLWGLLVCHHGAPESISPEIRDLILALVRMASEHLFLLESRSEMRYIERVLGSREMFGQNGRNAATADELIRTRGREYLDLVDACGMALVSQFGMSSIGMTPEEAVVERIADQLATVYEERTPWFTDQLSASPLVDAKNLSGCVGLLALPIQVESPPGWLFFFRKEEARTHRWAGKPEKILDDEQDRKILAPRHSFATWEEKVTGQSRPWTTLEVQAADNLGADMAVAISIAYIERLNGELSSANRKLQSLAQTDALTGLWNRYHLELELEAEINLSGGAHSAGSGGD